VDLGWIFLLCNISVFDKINESKMDLLFRYTFKAIKKGEAMKKKNVIMPMVVLVLFFAVLKAAPGGSDRDVQAIEAFAHLYGYVKYFHPSDEAAKIDWDRFAVYGAKEVASARDTADLKSKLEQLFQPIVPGIVIHPSNETAAVDWAAVTPPDAGGMKLVAWQHYGVRINNVYSPFHSIRLNRPGKIPAGRGFANMMNLIDASALRGKEFLFKASVKVESGSAQLWFRVDRTGKKAGFFDNMDDRPITSPDWQTYEMKGEIAPDATRILFGCILRGTGKAFVDEFQLLVKDPGPGSWTPAKIPNHGFEEEDEEKKAKYWRTSGQGYGFDYRLTNETAAAGDKSFIIESLTMDGPERLYSQDAKFGETIHEKLGMGLSCIVPLALYGSKEHTFPRLPEQDVENLLKAMENQLPRELTAAASFVRYGDVIIAWNVLRYFYPYFDVVAVDWPAQLNLALQKAKTDTGEEDFLHTLQLLTAALEDGQASVFHPSMEERCVFPILVRCLEDKVIITASRDETLQKGDIIVSVDGTAAVEVFRETEGHIPSSSRYRSALASYYFAYGPRDSTARILVERRGKTMEITARRNFNQPFALKEFEREPVEEIKEGVYYVDLAAVNYRAIGQVMAKLVDVEGVIFDTRGSPPYILNAVLPHLMDTAFQGLVLNIPEVIYPGREHIKYTGYDFTTEARQPLVKPGKTAFIVDGGAVGDAEAAIATIEHYKLGVLVGQPTAGTSGQTNYFKLPGGYRVTWTAVRALKQDRSLLHTRGVAPTVPVQHTIESIMKGKDLFLEKALEIVSQQEPMAKK
jgi:hypothetical protein